MTHDLHEVAADYVEAMGAGQYDRLHALLAPDVEFHGPYVSLHGAEQFISGLRRIAGVRVRHDLRKVLVDGCDACVIYDFVTDTPAGAVPFIEWLTFVEGKLRSTRLFFDREQFAPAREALQRMALAAES